MKRHGLVLGLMLSLSTLLGGSCADSSSNDWSCEDSGLTCAKTGQSVSACCTTDDKKCKYEVGSTDFPCGGTDCQSEASVVLNYCGSLN
jgi:hypothetical protein